MEQEQTDFDLNSLFCDVSKGDSRLELLIQGLQKINAHIKAKLDTVHYRDELVQGRRIRGHKKLEEQYKNEHKWLRTYLLVKLDIFSIAYNKYKKFGRYVIIMSKGDGTNHEIHTPDFHQFDDEKFKCLFPLGNDQMLLNINGYQQFYDNRYK
jgi:hypothetical protein